MPSAEIAKREMEFLQSEVSSWVEAEIITSEQAGNILSLYEVRQRNLRLIMLTAGIILLGLGAVSFMLAHWHELGKMLRVCIISCAYVASIIAYLFAGRSTKTGKSFLLLSSAVFGGGIYLITHMYDIELTLSEFLGLWIVETVAMSAITRDEWEMYLSQALSLSWFAETEAINIFSLYFVRAAMISVDEFFAPLSAFALLGALWLLWFSVRDRTALMIDMLLTILLFASRMSLCFGGTWTLIILAVTGAVMSFLAGYREAQIMGLLMLGVFGLLLTWPEFWRGSEFVSGRSVYAVINAVIVAGLMLFNIWRGHSGIGITFFALLAARYFFDHIFGFLPKAWGFTAAGIIFVIAGLFFGKIRKLFER